MQKMTQLDFRSRTKNLHHEWRWHRFRIIVFVRIRLHPKTSDPSAMAMDLLLSRPAKHRWESWSLFKNTNLIQHRSQQRKK